MPADRREQVRRLPSGKFQLRYYDRNGVRHSGGAFPSRSAARQHFRNEVEPALNGKPVAPRDLTLCGLIEVFLERHGKVVSPRTVRTLRERLQRPLGRSGRCL